MNTNYTVLYQGSYDGICDFKEQLLIESTINPGLYILGVSGSSYYDYGYWHIAISCKAKPPINASQYIFPSDLYSLYSRQGWSLAERYCEEEFGTTLATVATQKDMDVIRHEINVRDLWNIGVYYLWIGLYHEMSNRSRWQWIETFQGEFESTLAYPDYSASSPPSPAARGAAPSRRCGRCWGRS